jgi:hypothetical protein
LSKNKVGAMILDPFIKKILMLFIHVGDFIQKSEISMISIIGKKIKDETINISEEVGGRPKKEDEENFTLDKSTSTDRFEFESTLDKATNTEEFEVDSTLDESTSTEKAIEENIEIVSDIKSSSRNEPISEDHRANIKIMETSCNNDQIAEKECVHINVEVRFSEQEAIQKNKDTMIETQKSSKRCIDSSISFGFLCLVYFGLATIISFITTLNFDTTLKSILYHPHHWPKASNSGILMVKLSGGSYGTVCLKGIRGNQGHSMTGCSEGKVACRMMDKNLTFAKVIDSSIHIPSRSLSKSRDIHLPTSLVHLAPACRGAENNLINCRNEGFGSAHHPDCKTHKLDLFIVCGVGTEVVCGAETDNKTLNKETKQIFDTCSNSYDIFWLNTLAKDFEPETRKQSTYLVTVLSI